jgi:hypothetical protein
MMSSLKIKVSVQTRRGYDSDKTKCDGQDPCRRCMDLASKAMKMNERKVLQFSDCIWTSLKSVSIYEHGKCFPICSNTMTELADSLSHQLYPNWICEQCC